MPREPTLSRNRRDWWRTLAQEKDFLLLSLGYAQVPFKVAAPVLRDFERRCLREARTPSEPLHIQRLTAKDILAQAYADARPWRDFGPHLLRMERLGYPNLWMRVFVASIYVQSLALFPERAGDAFAMLDEAARRVKRMRRSDRFRKQLLDGIEQARQVAASQGLQPPGSGTRA